MVKFEVTGDERLTRTFLERLTDVAPPESSTKAAQKRMRVSFPAKPKGNIQIKTVSPLEFRILRTLMDLVTDNIKWMRRELHMDLKNSNSPAIGQSRGQLTSCPNTNNKISDSQEYNEAIAAIADCATELVDNFHENEAEHWRCCQLNLAGSRGATMTRTGRNLRSETSGVDSLQCSEHFLIFKVFLSS